MVIHHPLNFIFGLLGNIISFMVYLAPIPTFHQIYRKKTTAGFQSVPYVVSLFSAMLWIYYAIVKSNDLLLITINSIGCVIETVYIVMFMVYAPRKARISTARLLAFLNLGLFALILTIFLLAIKGQHGVTILGWICVSGSVSTFVAPLGIVRKVIRTKSVEFMPFLLSFFHTLSAIVWFIYGLLQKDIYVAIPNIIGFIFGILQMMLYVIYEGTKKAKVEITLENVNNVPRTHIVLSIPEIQPKCDESSIGEDHKVAKQIGSSNENNME